MRKYGWLALPGVVALLIVVKMFLPSEPDVQVVNSPVTAVPQVTAQPKTVMPTSSVRTPTPTPSPAPLTRQIEADTENDTALEEDETEEEQTVQKFVLCEHIISGETQYEFRGEIRLINKGTTAIVGWSVAWEYPDGSTLLDAKDVALAGSNPYIGEFLDWNAEIAPGETVTFSFNGLKGSDSPPFNVRVTGDICL